MENVDGDIEDDDIRCPAQSYIVLHFFSSISDDGRIRTSSSVKIFAHLSICCTISVYCIRLLVK